MIAYAITDSSTLNFKTVDSDLKRFSTRADMILYRDKSSANYIQNAKIFLKIANRLNFDRVLLHGEIELAYRLEADGVHLTSTQFDQVSKAKKLGLFVIISTHTIDEAKKAEELGADMVTFSPIFATPNKGKPKGIEGLKKVIDSLFIPVIALGGIISTEQIARCRLSGAGGFASIRYFK